jgi:carbonic anhydrase/acetyltransferase-like protein (isoleucine patch superfamily)
MSVMPEPLILPIRGRAPQLHAESWVAPNASVIGPVTQAARASVWYAATLRAEAEPIEIGFGFVRDASRLSARARQPGRQSGGVP